MATMCRLGVRTRSPPLPPPPLPLPPPGGIVWSKTRSTACLAIPEPEFVNLLKSPGIDPQPGGPVRHTGPPGYITSGIYSFESIPGLFECWQIRALDWNFFWCLATKEIDFALFSLHASLKNLLLYVFLFSNIFETEGQDKFLSANLIWFMFIFSFSASSQG